MHEDLPLIFLNKATATMTHLFVINFSDVGGRFFSILQVL